MGFPILVRLHLFQVPDANVYIQREQQESGSMTIPTRTIPTRTLPTHIFLSFLKTI